MSNIITVWWVVTDYLLVKDAVEKKLNEMQVEGKTLGDTIMRYVDINLNLLKVTNASHPAVVAVGYERTWNTEEAEEEWLNFANSVGNGIKPIHIDKNKDFQLT